MNRDLEYVLNYMVKYTKDSFMQDSEPMLNYKDVKIVLKHIYELEQENKQLKAKIDKAIDYTRGFINGKTSRIDEWKNVELVLETIVEILGDE